MAQARPRAGASQGGGGSGASAEVVASVCGLLRSRISNTATRPVRASVVNAWALTSAARLASVALPICWNSQTSVDTKAVSQGSVRRRAAVASVSGISRHELRPWDNRARPSPTRNAANMLKRTASWLKLSVGSARSVCRSSAQYMACAASPTTSTWATTVVTASMVRRKRPGGKVPGVRCTSLRSIHQMPSTAISRAAASMAHSPAVVRTVAAALNCVWMLSASAASRRMSDGQDAARLRQKSTLSGESVRSVSRSVKRARRWVTRSLANCWASMATRRASLRSLSSASRSFCRAARCCTMSTTSVPAPLAGAVPSCASRLSSSASWLLRSATSSSAWVRMVSIAASDWLMSPSSAGWVGMAASCWRSALGGAGVSAAAGVWAKAPLQSRAVSSRARRRVDKGIAASYEATPGP